MSTVRHIYTPRDRAETCWTSSQPSKTRQQFKDECDINIIMARYQTTGVIDFVNKHEGNYLDVTGYDFQNAADLVANASSMFMDLPSAVRNRFDNDPALFFDFVHDEANRDEAEKLGLSIPRPKPPAAPAENTPTA